MKSIINYICEKLNKINSKTADFEEFTDEELRKDYKEVWGATTKKEKQEIGDKYGCTDIKIRSIQIAILDILREHRNNKKEFTNNDVFDFIDYEIPEKQYEQYLDKETTNFVEYLFGFYEKKVNKLRCVQKYGINSTFNSYNSSIADRHLITIYRKIKKYLNK